MIKQLGDMYYTEVQLTEKMAEQVYKTLTFYTEIPEDDELNNVDFIRFVVANNDGWPLRFFDALIDRFNVFESFYFSNVGCSHNVQISLIILCEGYKYD